MANIFKQAILLIRWSGLSQARRILSYSLRRDRLDAAYHQAHPAQPLSGPTGPGKSLQTEQIPGGARLTFENASLEVVFLAADLARVTWGPGTEPAPYALAKTDWPGAVLQVEPTPEGGMRLASEALTLQVQANGSLQYFDAAGNLLRGEQPPQRLESAGGPAWSIQASLRAEERLYGLGEQSGPLDLRGTTHRMWNNDPGGAYQAGDDPIYMPVPVYIGLHGGGSYLVFYENHHPATFQAAAPGEAGGQVSFRFEGGLLRSYFIPGPPERLLERYSELTGRPGLPPLWSLGYHQSRWGYRTQEEIREVVRGFQAHDLPLSAIHLDIDYMDGYRVFTVDRERFPDLEKLASELAGQGIRLVTILDPGVKQDPKYAIYQEGLAGGHFCRLADGQTFVGVAWPGASVFPDFSRPETRSWWASQYRWLVERGAAGVWHDMNEPTSFTAWNGPFLPLETRHDLDGQGGDHRQGHNLYGLLMARAGWEGLRAAAPERRPWMITRSGWAGVQRYAWNWTGDSETSWESLRMTIATVVGSGLSGQPFNGPDIGGFNGNPPAELYLRWLQAATFLPFYRTHSAIGMPRREPWVYGEPYTRIIREFMRLRQRLMPTLYTLAWEAAQRGLPLARPLWWAEPRDPALWPIDDTFLLGEALLVAPVVEGGGTRRKLRLPAGDWYDLWDGTLQRGPGEVELRCGLERIPALVRGGRLLAMADGERLTLHLYAPPDGFRQGLAGQVYSDAGDGYGDSRLDRFTWQRQGRSLLLNWESQGAFPFPYRQVDIQLHGWQNPRTWVDEKSISLREMSLLSQPFQTFRLENP